MFSANISGLDLGEPLCLRTPMVNNQPSLSEPPPSQSPLVLGRLGSLQTRLAISRDEIIAAQRLRYQIFYQEMEAVCDQQIARYQLDADNFDTHCHHLLVLDGSQIVGTYRLLLDTDAKRAGGFYTQTEFDLAPLLKTNKHLRCLELGRSCIVPAYRNKRTIELLWAGIWAFAQQHNVGLMFGCASFAGTKPELHRRAFSWLHDHARLGAEEDCMSRTKTTVPLSNSMSPSPSRRLAFKQMPPLLKGYLRVGAKIGSEAVIDHQFGTVDVLVVLKVAEIHPRYLAHYGNQASRFAA
ncbi:MAG: GNAT family N-acyltransferase [Rhizobiaceae bacterium]